jgi:hypothetical protein
MAFLATIFVLFIFLVAYKLCALLDRREERRKTEAARREAVRREASRR